MDLWVDWMPWLLVRLWLCNIWKRLVLASPIFNKERSNPTGNDLLWNQPFTFFFGIDVLSLIYAWIGLLYDGYIMRKNKFLLIYLLLGPYPRLIGPFWSLSRLEAWPTRWACSLKWRFLACCRRCWSLGCDRWCTSRWGVRIWWWRVSIVCFCWIRIGLRFASTRPCVLSMTVNDRVSVWDMRPLRNVLFLALVNSSKPSCVHLQAVCSSVLALLAHRLVVCLLVDWW